MRHRGNNSTLRALFLHNDWAWDRLLDAAAPLPDEALDRPFDMGPGSLRKTIGHLWSVEQQWLDRWQGAPCSGGPMRRPSIAELARRFRRTACARNELLDRLGESSPRGDMMLHVCNHGFHHRAQAANMIRRLGAAAPELDYLHMTMSPSPQIPTDYGVDTIVEYFRYGDWARDRVLAVAGGLDDAALDRPFQMGMGSLRATLTHVCDAERWWLENWTRGMPDRFETMPGTTPVEAIRDAACEVSEARFAYLAGSSGGDLRRAVYARPRPGVDLTFVLGDTMLQLCGHGTHHRAQALNMLRRLGAEVPPLDSIDWVAKA